MVQINLHKELIGMTLTKCYLEGFYELHLITTNGDHFKMHHSQECCEDVAIEDICGDLTDLIGSPLVEVEVVTNSEDHPPDADAEMIRWSESFTWTFYKFRTAKGAVTIRWYGGSNGYYSESVDIERE